jgi:uncharacterized protein (DUF885 family)
MKLHRLIFLLTFLSSSSLFFKDCMAVKPTLKPALFSDKPNKELYWQALLAVAHNNKEAAQSIVTAIKENRPYTHSSTERTLHKLPRVLDDLFVQFKLHDPQGLNALSLFEAIGIRDHNAYLNDVSPEALLRTIDDKKSALEQLEQAWSPDLTAEEKLSYRVVRSMLDDAAGSESFIFHTYYMNQMFSILTNIDMTLTEFHAVRDLTDAMLYCARLMQIPSQLEQTIALMEHQKSLGIMPPKFALEKLVTQIERSLPTNATQHLFYTTLVTRLAALGVQNNHPLIAQAAQIIKEQLYPAYQQLLEYCRVLSVVQTRNDGVWALPNGDQYYAFALWQQTGVSLTPDEIHEIGLREVAKIHEKVRALLSDEGVNDPAQSVGSLVLAWAAKRPDNFPQTAEGQQACLDHFGSILNRCRQQLHPLFDLKPVLPVKIQAVPKHQEEGAPGAYYYPPSLDGSRPGIFYANLRNMDEMARFRMETLAIHEAEPGHHFQLALQQEMKLPLLRKLAENDTFNAYIEGWALYTEKLAYEENFYSSPSATLGHFCDELLRAARLVVDTGIHHKRWTREQAIEYMAQATGFHHDSVVTEVERYFVLPGQACSYKIGQLKILELRDRAKAKLGDKFDIRQFHNEVLKIGAVPLSVLETVIDEYINTTLAA